MKIFVNHLGYPSAGPKSAVVDAAASEVGPDEFRLENDQGTPVLEGRARPEGTVDGWRGRYWTLDFSSVSAAGRYRLALRVPNGPPLESEVFPIDERPYLETLADILGYFRSQRCAGKYDEADRGVPFFGDRSELVDVHGGWYDASGDVSKYLSHLSYANFMNPQQIPMVVWNMLAAHDVLASSEGVASADFLRQIRAEAQHGADFLVRMHDQAGYFYTTVFDGWSKDVVQRQICAYRTQKGLRNERYRAGYRQGGGVSIAALARMSTADVGEAPTRAVYLQKARIAFAHLERHNQEYLDDGRENIIDDYCALLAAAELFAATAEKSFREAARARAARLIARLSRDEQRSGWWRADDEGQRPFFHAAEAGLPALALLRWFALEKDSTLRASVLEALESTMRFELGVTSEVTNPFGYARQYVKPVEGPKRTSFFFPHENESGYWWQGENARLASLATAATLYRPFARTPGEQAALTKYAQSQLNWILGLNPFDSCMLFGRGRNNCDYEAEWPNVLGGICNGITSGFEDERSIDFARRELGPGHWWRWTEQWILHGAWYLLAVAAVSVETQPRGPAPAGI